MIKKQIDAGQMQKKAEKRVLDRDAEGRQLYEEDILAMLSEELRRRGEERHPLELQWILNANFLSGYQTCAINAVSGEIRDTEEEGIGVYNRIAPLVETRMAHLKQLRYTMTVRPATNEAEDEERARIATRLLSHLVSSSDFEAKRNMLISWSELCGSAFVLSWWDKDGGREIGTSEDGKALHEGELRYGLLTPYEVYPESIYKQDIGDQRSLLIEQVLTSDELFELYGVRIPGEEVDTFALTPAEGSATGAYRSSSYAFSYRTAHNSVRLLTWFERPNRQYPDGRLIIAAGDTLLFYGALPYDDIPIVSVKCKDMPGQFFGRSVITDLIPLQRAYNGVKNKIHDYIRTLAANPLLVPEGSVEDLESIEECGVTAGTVLEYNPDRGVPTPLHLADISSEVRRECDSLAAEMEYAAGVSQLMVIGSTPSGVTSGTAIESLRQIDSTRISLAGDNIRDAVKHLGEVWLRIYRRCATGCRVLEIVGANETGGALVWSAEDLNSFDIVYNAENELKYGEEAQKQQFFTALQMGLFNDENGRVPQSLRRRALELMRLGSYGELLSEGELHTQNARRENAMVAMGRVEAPGLYDDDSIHLEEHRRFALQQSFAALRGKMPEACTAFDRHIALHAERLQEQIKKQNGKEK